MKRTIHFLALLILFVWVGDANAQLSAYKGNRLYRYYNIHSGNKVRTIFYNYGLVGNINEISGEWPVGTGDEYIGDVSIVVGAELKHPSGETLHCVSSCKTPRGTDNYSPDGKTFWGFEPLPGFGSPPIEGSGEAGLVAMSHEKWSWPQFWPDKMYTDPRDQLWEEDNFDPGWPGAWNGYFGKDVTNADQESYYQMDDTQDMEFRRRMKVDADGHPVTDENGNPIYVNFYPDPLDTTRGGLGLRVAVRGFQWSHFQAQDVILWHYEITNVGAQPYDKVAFGMVVGTLAGGRQDSNDDLAFFDATQDITYSWDSDDIGSPGWVPVNSQINVGSCGYAFLESPGNPFDGIDNDGDASPSSPRLTVALLQQMTDTMTFSAGDPIILIDYESYARTDTTMPADSLVWYVRGDRKVYYEGEKVVEDGGNGIDDNFNGLIDERLGEPIQGKRLDHVGLAYKNYFTGEGVNDPMIDEARDDGIDNDGDWDPQIDDVGFDGKQGTGDRGEGDGVPTPGEPHFDKTDIDESDQIGLTSFNYFNNSGADKLFLRNDEDVWNRMRPGYLSVVPSEPMDGDFIYGSAYFPLPPGKTQRFSLGLFFGADTAALNQKKVIVQQIYDNNYNFARPPEKPNVKAVAGDGQVTLYWDDISESSIDQFTHLKDFEGYKIYRATDPGFLENFIITDGRGNQVFHKPIAQFDQRDNIKGYYSSNNLGVSFYLGNDSGLEHVWTDSTAENGQTYYYAVTAYDFGSDSLGIFPAETSKFVFVDEAGKITTDVNTVAVTPTPASNGYRPAMAGVAEQEEGMSDGTVYVEVIDPTVLPKNRNYTVSFTDESANYEAWTAEIEANNRLVQSVDLSNTKDDRRVFHLFDARFDSVYGIGDGNYETRNWFSLSESVQFDGMRAFILKPLQPGKKLMNLSGWESVQQDPDSLLNWQFDVIYYPIDGFIGDSLFADYQLEITQDVVDTSLAASYGFGFYAKFDEHPLHFRVTNLLTGEQPLIYFKDNSAEWKDNSDGFVHDGSVIHLLEMVDKDGDGVRDDTTGTWAFEFKLKESEGKIHEPLPGDKLTVRMYKPFRQGDEFTFTPKSASWDAGSMDLDRIKVYPNPYLAANSQEPLNSYSTGRGERRITFNHLPPNCIIRIYTVRGELVKTINHYGNIFDGSENWDLRNMDGLDVAYGIYIYHVETKDAEHVGKFAIIK